MDDDLTIALAMCAELSLISSGLAVEMASRGLLHETTAGRMANSFDNVAEYLDGAEVDELTEYAALLHSSAILLRRVRRESP
ncbi:hypothetical protein [Sphingopyxis lindanitolerans]|uniref:hypothetical protein n=1 Tax=Sphingopyxis lindanitolerans TaxID=2054227 RepID=UPI0011B21185|nr:hypothetical protein [Sphingopyxis lindanitolerans]